MDNKKRRHANIPKRIQKIHRLQHKTFGQINEIKVLLDHTSEHTIKKNGLESPTWKKTTKILREEGQIIHATIHQILVIILTKTTLKNWTIKNEDMQIYQREYKKYTDYNTKQNNNPNNTNPQNIQTTIQ